MNESVLKKRMVYAGDVLMKLLEAGWTPADAARLLGNVPDVSRSSGDYNMRFKVGSTVVVVQVYSGGNFKVGDIVKVCQIGYDDEHEKNCYGAVSPHDGIVWYLFEDEVAPCTNGDLLRSMSDQSLGEWICSLMTAESCDTRCPAKDLCGPDRKGLVRWMKEETVVKN